MQLWWGPEELVFYNEAAIPILGERHPNAFGQPAPDVWGERWRTIRSGEGVTLTTIDNGVLCVHPMLAGNDDLLRSLGHELRNPLSVLSTTIQALLLTTPSREVDMMARAVQHLTWLVEDLLDLSRHARSALAIRRDRVELAQVIDRAMELVAPIVAEREDKIFVSMPRSGLHVDGDRERLARVFANVVSTAALRGSGGAQVTLEAAREREWVRVVIRDPGEGMMKESLALASARALVELHGGTLRISVEGCEIELPIASSLRPAPEAPRGPRKRVLIVEDQDDTARSLKHALEQIGYAVAMAHDGPVALHVQRTFEPEVVLLDIGLPVMDGWELARRLRDRGTPVHVVAVTGRDQLSDQQRSLDLGFAEHFVKPVDLGRLEALIEGLSSPARPGQSSDE